MNKRITIILEIDSEDSNDKIETVVLDNVSTMLENLNLAMTHQATDTASERDELLAVLRQVRDFYLNADSAWRFSEGFPIDVVCRAIGKAEGLPPEPFPPFDSDEMSGDEDRP